MSAFRAAPSRYRLLCSTIALLSTAVFALPPAANTPPDRQMYLQARADLAQGRLSDYRVARGQLDDYPLTLYLDYFELRRDIKRSTREQIETFRANHPATPVAVRLHRAWLLELARRQAWEEFSEQYEPVEHTELRCYHLEALLRTGKRDRALEGVPELWQVPRSQPKACDPVFGAWLTTAGPSETMAWTRLREALSAGETTLARYVLRFLEGDENRWGHTFIEVHRNPKLIRNYRRFSIDNGHIRDILAHGIPRLVRTDPNDAQAAWAHYRASHAFGPSQAQLIEQDLTIALARRGAAIVAADLTPTEDGRHVRLADSLLQNAVQRSDWAALVRWYGALTPEQQQEPKWRYWYARALAIPEHVWSDPSQGAAQLGELANVRHYYGFLAAHNVGIAPRLNARPTRIDPVALRALRSRPGMIRIEELLAVGDTLNARREWQFLQGGLSPPELAAGAHVAAELGWTQQSIFAANAAELRDDLELRFPTPHRNLFATESRATSLPMGFLYGIARQESAFAPDAESSAGALGMMQLMPSTAALTARRMGLRTPAKPRLKDPNLNVKLGSRYLASLMDRYDGNRALAAAAYNAGPGRVDRWLAAVPAQPADVWIESVPFPETRSYVKNVLAFSYIYSEKLGDTALFLEPTEH